MALPLCLRKVVLERWQRLPEPEGTVRLEERGVMRVQVSGLAADSLVLRMEKIALSGVEDGPWKKSCDYAIVNPDGDSVRILFVELKRTLTDESKALEQLRWSLPRLEHLRSLCQIDCAQGPLQAEVRYALVAARGNPRLDKQPIKRKSSPRMKQHEGIEVSLHVVASQEHFSRLWGD